MELLEYWKIIQKRLWLIILLMLLGGGSAAYYTSQQVDQYQSSTTLFINPGRVSPLVPGETFASPGNSRVEALVNTYTELMRTRSFVERVADELHEAMVSAQTVRGALSTQYVAGTQFFRISAVHTDPEIAQQIASTAADVLIAREVQRQQAQQEQLEAQQNPQLAAERLRLEQLIGSIQAELDYYEEQINETEQEILAIQDQPEAANQNNQLEELFADLENLRYVRIDILRQLTEAQARRSDITTTTQSPLDTAVVVDEALVPDAPIPRNDTQRILLAIAVGLMMGVGLTFLLEYIDYTVRTPESLEAVYGLPVQGVVAMAEKKYLKKQSSLLVALSANRSPIAESFRALRTGVQVANMGTPLRSLLVTSAGPGEGKTFVAANLAVGFAMNGSRVILVDADLRKPRLHQVFGVSREVGLTNLIVNRQYQLEDALLPTSVKNLQVLPCGIVPPNPAELLNSQRVAELMKQLTEHADIVIYDSPPAATVTDAAILAQRVDAVLQVVWAGHTRINHVLRCKAVLEHVGANILGTVLNQVKTEDLGYYSYYYYYGYYRDQEGSNGSLLSRMLPGRKKKKQHSDDMFDIAHTTTSSNGTGATHPTARNDEEAEAAPAAQRSGQET